MNALNELFREMGVAPKAARQSDAAAVYALVRTAGLAIRELSGVYQRFGLTAASFNLLMLLRHGASPASFTQQVLSRRLVVSPSDITGLVDRLESRQLVQRTAGKDRRSKLLRITPKGTALLDDVWPHHLEAVARLTAGIGRTDLDSLLRILSRLRGAAVAQPRSEHAQG